MGLLARFRSSLSYPIAATLVLVTVVPVVVVGLHFVSRNREHLTTTEKQYLTRQAVSLAIDFSLKVFRSSSMKAGNISMPEKPLMPAGYSFVYPTAGTRTSR